MKFIPWSELNDEQKEACRQKWPQNDTEPKRYLETCEIDFMKDGVTPYVRRPVQMAEVSGAPVAAMHDGKLRMENAAAASAVGSWNGAMLVARGKIMPSPLNPRKSFDDAYLKQLAETLKEQGFINDLVVRPLAAPVGEAVYEIVAGECRWRSSAIAGIEELPIKVRELSDADVLALMLVENMKRKDLTVVEESDAFNQALAQKNADGTPVYATLAQFAGKIGEEPGYVKQRLALKKLPAAGRAALESDDISFKTARWIVSVPESIVEKVLDVVLHPSKHDVWTDGEQRCLNAEETKEMIRERFVRELRDTPFQQNDGKLFPVQTEDGERVRGGACSDCPWNSANQVAEEGEASSRRRSGGPGSKWCMNPDCFTKKVEIHSAAALVKAQEDGCKLLSAEESSKLFYGSGALKSDSMVLLNERPGYSDRNNTIEEKKLPTWGKIVTGEATVKVVVDRNAEGEAVKGEVSEPVSVQVIAAVTPTGHVVKMVERKAAVAAAQKVGTAHFLNLSAGGGRSLAHDDYADRQRKEREEQKLRNEVSMNVVTALVAKVAFVEKLPDGFSSWLLEAALWHAGADGWAFVAKRRGLATAPQDSSREIRSIGKKMNDQARLALALELFIGREIKYSGHSGELSKALFKLYAVDAGKIDKEMREAAKAKKKEKADAVKKKVAAAKAAAAKPKKPKIVSASADDQAKDAEVLKELSSDLEAAELGGLSSRLNTLREERGLSHADVDKIAKKACGRKWPNFKGKTDYEATIAEVEKLSVTAVNPA